MRGKTIASSGYLGTAYNNTNQMVLTIKAIAASIYFQPRFIIVTSQRSFESFGQENFGMMMIPTMAEKTEPKEKKTDKAVTRYCLCFGTCSRRSVPSVGIEPFIAMRIYNVVQVSNTYPNRCPEKEESYAQGRERGHYTGK